MKTVAFRPGTWPVRLLCVSDTHVPTRARRLPDALLTEASRADLVVHAGDLVSREVLIVLGARAPVVAVAGNMDTAETEQELGRAAVVEVGPWRIGLVHGDEGGERDTPSRALATFLGAGLGCRPAGAGAERAVDVVVFGHSHQPLVDTRCGVLLVNPGSATDCRFAPWPSCATLTLEGPERNTPPRAEIRRLPRPGQGR
ncbi:MAG: metallophosphoesterase [Bacillota bacterium]|nr:MAG: metallophosphoesterase [Bacillota bacterium]